MKSLIKGSIALCLVTANIYAGGDITPLEPVTDIEDLSLDRFYNVGLKVGTLGVGIEVSTPVSNNVAIRFNINGGSYSRSEKEKDIDYDGDIDFLNAGLLVDYFPFEDSAFRLSGGAYYNGNELCAVGKPRNGTYRLDDVEYDAELINTLTAGGDFDKFAPYIGLGWGNNSSLEGLSFSLDVGMLIGKPDIQLDVTRGNATDAEWNLIQKSAANEQESIDEDYNDISVYPVVMLGMTYRF